MSSEIARSRLMQFISVRKRGGLHILRYQLICDGIVLSSHLTEHGAREAMRRNDLWALAFDIEHPGVFASSPMKRLESLASERAAA